MPGGEPEGAVRTGVRVHNTVLIAPRELRLLASETSCLCAVCVAYVEAYSGIMESRIQGPDCTERGVRP